MPEANGNCSPIPASSPSPPAAGCPTRSLASLSLKSNGLDNQRNSQATIISLLHFNDCYNVEQRAVEPAGGAARFKTALTSFIDYDPVVLFSGDILGPSISEYFKVTIYV